MTCDEVKQHILKRIESSKIGAGERLPPFRALANEFETSIPTVQRAVAMLVSEGVLFSKIGSGTYVCDKTSRGDSKRMVGILLPYSQRIEQNFISEVLEGARARLLEKGYIPVAVSPPPGLSGKCRSEAELALVEQLIGQGIAGIVIDSGVAENDPLWARLDKLKIPVVFFNNKGIGDSECDYVTSDNYQGGRLVANRLIEAGKTPCAFVSNMDESKVETDRLRGFSDALKSAGFPPPTLINIEMFKGNKSPNIREILGKCKGIFAINDSTAIGMLTRLRNEGISVPGECGVIGFDDSELCEHVIPRLDSVRQQSRFMGERTAELMMRRLENHNVLDTVTVKLHVDLICRDSVSSR